MTTSTDSHTRDLSRNDTLASLERTVASMTGETAETLRSQTLDQRRKAVEALHKTAITFVSKFPFIGRGNVLRDKIVSGAQVNALLDKALR